MFRGRMSGKMDINGALEALTNGNSNSFAVCQSIINFVEIVDPAMTGGALGYFKLLDALEIYEERIYALSIACGRDPINTLILLRAYQLGILDMAEINNMIDGNKRIDLEATAEAVRKQLPDFM